MTVFGENGTVDNDTNLTGQGSVTTASLRPPTGRTKIKKIFWGAASDQLVDGGTCFGVTFPGAGVKNGPHRILLGSAGGDFTTGADNAGHMVHGTVEDVDIEISGDDITIQGSLYGGAGTSNISFSITLYFE